MTKIHTVGRLYELDGSSFLAKVPLVITTIPELPQAVTIGVKVFSLTNTVPLTYTRITSREVKRK